MNPFNDKITRAAQHLVLALLASLVLVSCGGGGGGGGSTPTPTAAGANEVLISGRAAKGTILNATVRATQIINGQLGGTQKNVALGSNGDFSVSMPKGLIHLQVITQADSTTQDEATGVAVALPPEFKFRAAADLTDSTATTVSLNITPYSEAGVALAEKSGGLTAANINKANSGIANILGFDHLGTTPIQSSDTAALASATTNEKKLSVLNAAVSNMAATDALGCGVKATYGQTIDCTVAKLADQFQMNIAASAQPIVAGILQTTTANSTPMVLFGDTGYQSLLAGIANAVGSGAATLAKTTVELVQNGVSFASNFASKSWDNITSFIGSGYWIEYQDHLRGRNFAQAGNDFYQYAQLSSLVYQNEWVADKTIGASVSGAKDGGGLPIEGDWVALDWKQLLPDYLQYLRPSQAANVGIGLDYNVFISASRQQVVFVYRGTASYMDWISDFSLATCAIDGIQPPQYSLALQYFDSLKPIIQGYYKNFTIITTGHSLGGGIASYIATQHPQEVQAVGFNSAPVCGISATSAITYTNIRQVVISGEAVSIVIAPLTNVNRPGVLPPSTFPNPVMVTFEPVVSTLSHFQNVVLFTLDVARSLCAETSGGCSQSYFPATSSPAPIANLAVSGIQPSYTASVTPYRPSISLSGTSLSAINQISWTCTQPNGAACTGSPYVWTPNNWAGKVDIFNDTSIKVYPGLLAMGDAAGTYNWSATFSALNSTPVSIPFSVTYQPQLATGIVVDGLSSAMFTAGTTTISTTTNPIVAALTVTGKNLGTVARIEWRWSGAATGSATWQNSDSTWSSKVAYTPDGKLTLFPTVVEANAAWSGTTIWTGTLLDGAGTSQNITFAVVYQPPVLPVSPTLGFTSPGLGTVSATTVGYQPTLTASGNVTQVSFSWSGATSGSTTWVKNDANWLSKVTANPDGSITLRPVLTQTGDPSGTTNWTVTLRDSTGATQAQSFTVNYQPTTSTAQPTISTTAFNPATATVGVGYGAMQAVTATGGQTPYSCSASGLPNGMGINSSSCAVYGTPTVSGTFNVTVTVYDSSNPQKTASKVLTLTVAGSPAPTSKLNDTGITASQCYQAGSDVLVACSSAGAIALNNAQDGMAGRDANVATNSNTDGKLGLSFASVTGGCVQDNVTGLMWEVKTADGGLRDRSKTYTNYSATYNPSGLYGTSTDASGFVTAVNASNLCGYSDWRLPTADELQSIVDYGVAYPGPTIDTTWFPNTLGSVFWSASPSVGVSYRAWYVDFGGGVVLDYGRVNGGFVRLVRAGQSPIPPRYTVSADGQEVMDNQTKLIWRRCAEGMVYSSGTCTGTASTFTHEAALQRAATQAGSTGIAWRLPNVKELSSIADKSLSNPAIDSAAFPATPAYFFWSASPVVSYSGTWYVSFYDGFVFSYGRVSSNYMRLVRAGGGNESSTGGGGGGGSGTAAQYFTKKAVGNTWPFLSTATVTGQSPITFTYVTTIAASTGGVVTFSDTSNGVTNTRTDQIDTTGALVSTSSTHTRTLLPATFSVGTTYLMESAATSGMGTQNATIAAFNVTRTVPAGTFTDCLQINVPISYTDNGLTMTGNMTYYLSPTTGYEVDMTLSLSGSGSGVNVSATQTMQLQAGYVANP